VLLILGASFIVMPHQIELLFGFTNLPLGVSYIIALLGCALGSLAWGYLIAATDPVRHVAWVQLGIARGSLEVLVGVIYMLGGVVTLRQSAIGTVVALLITVAYIVVYPRPSVAERPA
jgi:hypothetical protein